MNRPRPRLMLRQEILPWLISRRRVPQTLTTATMPPDPKPETVTRPESEFDRLHRSRSKRRLRREAVVMRDPQVKRCPPKKPSWSW